LDGGDGFSLLIDERGSDTLSDGEINLFKTYGNEGVSAIG